MGNRQRMKRSCMRREVILHDRPASIQNWDNAVSGLTDEEVRILLLGLLLEWRSRC